jgi:integrase
LERAGIKLSRVAGAHLLRHSLASQLVKQRRPINEVADLLGLRSIDTSAIYLKATLPTGSREVGHYVGRILKGERPADLRRVGSVAARGAGAAA